MVEKISGISQEELDHFRETICGKINTEVKDAQPLAPAFIKGKALADVVTTTTS